MLKNVQRVGSRVAGKTPNDLIYVTWSFTTTCNFTCSYCPDHLHDGKYGFPKYEDALNVIQIMSISVIPATIGQMLMSKFLGQENARIILAGRIGFAGSFITSILVLTPIFGINGAASSFVIASILQCIILFIYLKIWRERR